MAWKAVKEQYPRLHRTIKQIRRQPGVKDNIYNYVDVFSNWRNSPLQTECHFECVTPMWDNSARRNRGATIVRDSTPELYEQWLREAVSRSTPDSSQQRTVFINAWNEWAEGSHLEPCQKWGLKYLEATKRVYDAG